jgi:tetratricopeptide (TPR) repeat protein
MILRGATGQEARRERKGQRLPNLPSPLCLESAHDFTAGNKAVAAKDYKAAVRHYGMAINMDPTDAVYYSNRSAAHCGLGDNKAALEDAHKATELRPDWPKGFAREGFAFRVPSPPPPRRPSHPATGTPTRACGVLDGPW